MKKLRIIIFSFISIIVIGIILTNTLININLDNGIHMIELEDEEDKSVEVSVESKNDTLKINEKNTDISDVERDYINTVFNYLEANISIKSGIYKLTF